MKSISLWTLVAAGLLVLCMTSDAALVEAVEDAHELSAQHVLSVSDKDNGELIFKSCDSCAASKLKMTAATYFKVNRRPVTRQAFWTAVRGSKGNVYLFVNISTGKVSRVELDG